ncbi:hypothetical protein [Actinophytocola sp.]|uniref:hypothetical protein n=1 Tax=Actinophytocola sp. TaxID=1872138 RepID=UPI002ED64651
MDQYESKVFVSIGRPVDARVDRVAVRLPRAVAEAAVSASERDEPADETHATLAPIGLAISERGRWADDAVVVDLDVATACAAARAAR